MFEIKSVLFFFVVMGLLVWRNQHLLVERDLPTIRRAHDIPRTFNQKNLTLKAPIETLPVTHEAICNPHIVFSTFKCPKCDSLRQRIEDNTLHVWSNMNKVTFEVVSDVATNKYNVPILGDMYTKMFQKCPDAQTYTYVNGDILGTTNFVETIEAVQSIGEFLMVGQRTNTQWSEKYDAKHANFSFDTHFERGVLFRTDGLDYFTVTKNAIDWNKIPPFVVGRPGYDNWLLDHIYHNPKVALIDASKTISVIHQTDSDGNMAHGGKMVKTSVDKHYNEQLFKGRIDHGHTYHAEWESERVNGKIILKHRKSVDTDASSNSMDTSPVQNTLFSHNWPTPPLKSIESLPYCKSNPNVCAKAIRSRKIITQRKPYSSHWTGDIVKVLAFPSPWMKASKSASELEKICPVPCAYAKSEDDADATFSMFAGSPVKRNDLIKATSSYEPCDYGCVDIKGITLSFSRYSDVLYEFDGINAIDWGARPIPPRPSKPSSVVFISNCIEWRMNYMKALSSNGIDIQFAGGCATTKRIKNCGRNKAWGKCKLDALSKHPFVITFENTIIDDFVTEKWTHMWNSGAIPVYMGSPTIYEKKADYPPFINALDFETPASLALYMQEVLRNDTLWDYYTQRNNIKRPLKMSVGRKFSNNNLNVMVCDVCRVIWNAKKTTLVVDGSTIAKDLTEKTIVQVPKPMIAICAATHSKSNWRSLDDTSLQNLLIPSIERTISTSDRSKYDFRLYLAADHDDHFWLNNKNNVKTSDWLSVHLGFYEVPEHKIPFNPMMRAAYNDGAEYLVRINDDSEFMTSDWVNKAVAKLASYDPPNVGMVGPNCREGNTAIMTHDMVHRTHLDIFEHYYPDVFSAWWIDDWISKVYGPERSTKMMDWTVKHHTYKHGTRYKVQGHEAKLLKGELEKGAGKIREWLLTRAENMDETEPWSVCVTVTNGFHDMFNNWWFYYSKLHLNMNVIMIAEDQPTYEKYSSLPGIEVWKAQFEDLNEKTSLNYDTVQFKKLMSRRASHFLRVLDLKPKIIFTDIDTVWLQDPRPFFAGNFDIWAQLDDEKYYCAGFIAVIKSDIVMKFFKDWNQKLTKTPQHNQPLFNKLIHKSDVKHKGLPRREFPSGNLYFGQKKRDGVVVVHNNFIIGKDKKIQRFKKVGLWHQKKLEEKEVSTYEKKQASKLNKNYAKISKWDLMIEKQLYDRFSKSKDTFEGPVLCVGARLGGEVRAFKRITGKSIGIDFNPGKNNPDVIYGDAMALQFENNHFNTVYCNILDHIPDLKKAFGEMIRVLNPGGTIFFDIDQNAPDLYAVRDLRKFDWDLAESYFGKLKEKKTIRDEKDPGKFFVTYKPK